MLFGTLTNNLYICPKGMKNTAYLAYFPRITPSIIICLTLSFLSEATRLISNSQLKAILKDQSGKSNLSLTMVGISRKIDPIYNGNRQQEIFSTRDKQEAQCQEMLTSYPLLSFAFDRNQAFSATQSLKAASSFAPACNSRSNRNNQ